MINNHNTQTKFGRQLEIKRTVFYTGYLLSPMDTNNLLTLVKSPETMNKNDIRFLAQNILITYGPAQQHVLDKVGGLGSKQTWRVTGFGVLADTVWAARVTPVPPTSQIHTENTTHFVLLAHYRNSRPTEASRISNWQPVSADKQYIFQTTVGEKVQLRIEPATDGESEYDNPVSRQNLKRHHSPNPQYSRGGYGNEENRRTNGPNINHRNNHQSRNRGGATGRNGGNNNNNRSGRAINAGRSGGGNNRGRGGAQRGGYRSLDDVASNGVRYGAEREPNYDDYVPAGDNYNDSFPAMGSGGGLPYGK